VRQLPDFVEFGQTVCGRDKSSTSNAGASVLLTGAPVGSPQPPVLLMISTPLPFQCNLTGVFKPLIPLR
jgi:hypothetical protein